MSYKKTFIIFSILIISVSLLISCSAKHEDNVLTVYAYDSFCSPWGPGQQLVSEFEEKTGHKINLVSCGAAVEMYSRILYEGSECEADVVIGLSDLIPVDKSLFHRWTPQCANSIIPYDTNNNLIPFDYSYFSFVYDSQELDSIPQSLWDLLDEKYKKKIILIDPRTSSVGLGTLLWTVNEMGEEKAMIWWNKIMDNTCAVAQSWSGAYGMFTQGEAPIVISYASSPVYHLMNDKTDRYKNLIFEDRYLQTVEYIGIMEKSENKDIAVEFCEYLLNAGQSSIAIANTMFPANKNTILPEEYSKISIPENYSKPSDLTSEEINTLLDKWVEAVTK